MKQKYNIEGGFLELNMKEEELTIRRKIVVDGKTSSKVVEIPKGAIHKLLCFLEGICYEGES